MPHSIEKPETNTDDINLTWFNYSDDKSAYNLAIDEALMRNFNLIGQPIFRLWDQEQPAVLVGRYQSPFYNIDLEFCLDHDIPICRRITGGTTFYQDNGALNFSFFATDMDKLLEYFRSTIFELCSSFSEDIKLEGPLLKFKNKIFGAVGLYYGKESYMLQGSIFYSINLANFARICRRSSYQLNQEIMNLGEISNLPLTLFKQLIVDYTHKSFSKLPELIKKAEKIYNNRYNSERWTFKRQNLVNWKEFPSPLGRMNLTIALETSDGLINEIQFFSDAEAWDRNFVDAIEVGLKGEPITKEAILSRLMDFNQKKIENVMKRKVEQLIDNIFEVHKLE